ncbi:MAG: c-type cytochrome [Deltaproteobacteria bacterium]
MKTFATLVYLLLSTAALAEPALLGDVAHGASLFKAHCASCHGAEARQTSAGMTEALRDPAFLAMRSDEELLQAISKGSGRMPAFPRFPELDMWDVVAWLRAGQPQVADFFPDAAFFTAKRYPLDRFARERAEQAMGRPLSASEAKLAVVTVYGRSASARGPERVPQDPVSLDKLSPKDKVGYVVFMELPRGDGKGVASYGLSLAPDGRLLRIASAYGANKPSVDRDYQPFVGLGRKGQDSLGKPRGKRVSPKVEAAIDRAYARAIEAVTMADKEEKDRHWADQK